MFLDFFAKRFFLFVVLACPALLTGCGCGTVDCDACNPLADELILFRLSADSLQSGFRRAEVASTYVVRYANPDFTQPRDTIRQSFRALYQGLGYTERDVALNLLFATKVATANEFLRSSYRIAVPAASRQFDVTGLDIISEEGTGCCACSFNARRRYSLNGTTIVADGTSYAGTELKR